MVKFALAEKSCVNFHGSQDLKKWIVLDNQSTTDIFCNRSFLNNIPSNNEQMTVYTNGVSITTTQKAVLEGYGEPWYHPGAMINILSMNSVKKEYRVTYDCKVDKFTIQKPDRLAHGSKNRLLS